MTIIISAALWAYFNREDKPLALLFYNEQSEVNINQYLLNINSRKIFKKDKTLKLTSSYGRG